MAQGTPELIEALGQIDPRQPYGTALFNALTRLTITVTPEAVCLRRKWRFIKLFGIPLPWRETQVYLVQRSQADTAYPGEWHCPGSAVRPGENIKDVFCRLEKNEFGGRLRRWKFVKNFNHLGEARGHFLSLIYLCAMDDVEGLRGRWFSVKELPKNTVAHHRDTIIPVAVRAF